MDRAEKFAQVWLRPRPVTLQRVAHCEFSAMTTNPITVTQYPLRPGTVIDFVGTFAYGPASALRQLGSELSVVTWPKDIPRQLLVVGSGITPELARQMAWRMNAAQIIGEADFLPELLTLRQYQQAQLAPPAPYMQPGHAVCLAGTMPYTHAELQTQLQAVGMRLARTTLNALALILGSKATGKQAVRLREQAQQRGLPIVEQGDFINRDLPRLRSDRRWDDVATIVHERNNGPKPDAFTVWKPQATRYQLAL